MAELEGSNLAKSIDYERKVQVKIDTLSKLNEAKVAENQKL